MNRSTVRRIAGWAVLSLIPLVFVTLAVLAGQLAEMAVGVGIAAFLGLTTWAGVTLLSGGRRP
ncbi:hypothetical protein JL475_00225 [Streptomyces sp. M2CJ-2]|uniref:hypothetical protein n=1 Tax=Streptomyces sp. M2CJ-2 TaxID=2803948 RepID=UPI0019247CCF|nr:hypothetical protein [Streptomyces sp. M2CJ-2]MBL3664471.1 hypothetical protein [Streptomyces sp. M2CJ-2]